MRRVASRSWGRRFGSTPRRHAISPPGHLPPSRLATRGFWPSSLPVSLRKSLGQFQPLFLARRILVDPCRRQDAIAAWASLFDFPATAKRVTQPSELPLRSDSDWLACALILFRIIPFRLHPLQKRIPGSARANVSPPPLAYGPCSSLGSTTSPIRTTEFALQILSMLIQLILTTLQR